MPSALGLLALGVLAACTGSGQAETGVLPDTGVPIAPSRDVDASAPQGDLDAGTGAAGSATQLPEQACQALSNACPFVRCEDPASTLAAASGQCGSPPFIRGVNQGSACGRTFVAYRYGAGDTTIAFFDMETGDLTGWWNKSDTGSIACSGEVDLSCATLTEMSLPSAAACLPDAGAAG